MIRCMNKGGESLFFLCSGGIYLLTIYMFIYIVKIYMVCDRGCVVYNMIFLALFTHHTDKKTVF
jgi:hypothetical protein